MSPSDTRHETSLPHLSPTPGVSIRPLSDGKSLAERLHPCLCCPAPPPRSRTRALPGSGPCEATLSHGSVSVLATVTQDDICGRQILVPSHSEAAAPPPHRCRLSSSPVLRFSPVHRVTSSCSHVAPPGCFYRSSAPAPLSPSDEV